MLLKHFFPFFWNVGKTCRSERQDWHWFSTQTAAVSSPSCFHVSHNTTTKSSTGSGKSGFMTGRRRDMWGKRRVKSPHRVLPIKSSWKHLTTRWAWRVGGCGYVNFLNGGFFQVSTCAELGDKKKKKSLTTVYIQSWLHDVDLTFASTFTQLVAKTSHSCCLFGSFFFVLSEMRGWIYISVRCDTHASLCSALCSCYSSELLFFVPSLSGKDDFFVYLVILVFQCPIAIKPRFVYKSHMGPQTQWFVYWIEGRRHVTLQSLTLWQRRQNATWAPNFEFHPYLRRHLMTPLSSPKYMNDRTDLHKLQINPCKHSWS